MNAHNWLTEQEHRRLTDVGKSELGKRTGPSKFTTMASWGGYGSLKVICNVTIIKLCMISNSHPHI